MVSGAKNPIRHEDAMIHILLLDDHAVVRTGYRRLIDAEADMRVVAEAATADEACAASR